MIHRVGFAIDDHIARDMSARHVNQPAHPFPVIAPDLFAIVGKPGIDLRRIVQIPFYATICNAADDVIDMLADDLDKIDITLTDLDMGFCSDA
jgi:hypothetical protein